MARMTARDIYASLSDCDGWREESRKVRWLASRYYAGADSAEDLYRMCERVPISRNMTLDPPLTVGEVAMIIRRR